MIHFACQVWFAEDFVLAVTFQICRIIGTQTSCFVLIMIALCYRFAYSTRDPGSFYHLHF